MADEIFVGGYGRRKLRISYFRRFPVFHSNQELRECHISDRSQLDGKIA